MCAAGWPITFLLFRLFGSATSSPVSPAPPLPLQLLPPSPSPTRHPSGPPPSLSIPSPFSTVTSTESTESCLLTVNPPTLVVRFGDPVKANCSIQRAGFPLLGWEVPLENPDPIIGHFLVWSIDNITMWGIKPVCYVLSEQQGDCHINLSLTVYQPPKYVSISFVNHTDVVFTENMQYTLQCTVQEVAPVANLTVTFYRGDTALGRLQSSKQTETPVTETFTLDIILRKEDNGVQYWCEATLELGPEGPQPPPVVMSQKISVGVKFGPQLICPAKLPVREGEGLKYEVMGNPPPTVTWFRNGEEVTLPAHSSRELAGHYIMVALGFHGKRTCKVEVEVLAGNGTANGSHRLFLMAVLLIQIINWL